MSKRKKTKHADGSSHRASVLMPLVSLFFAIGVVSLGQYWLKISDVNCHFVDGSVCPIEVTDQTQQLIGKPLLFYNNQKFITDQVATVYPVSLVRVTKQLPNKINLTLQPEPAEYLITAGDSTYQVSQSGLIFSNTNQTGGQLINVALPTDQLSDQNQLNEETHIAIMQILTSAENLGLIINEMNWIEQLNIELTLIDHQETFVVDADKVELDLARLKTIIESDEYRSIEGQPQTLDLRFELPVLRTTQ